MPITRHFPKGRCPLLGSFARNDAAKRAVVQEAMPVFCEWTLASERRPASPAQLSKKNGNLLLVLPPNRGVAAGADAVV
jgi:hypothetical protein